MTESVVEVRQARYFIAVAEELNFGRAAERLNMSQPPLSQAILQLERQLGATLLARSTRNVQLTEAGRVFLDECRQLVDASLRARDAALQAHSGFMGTLRIGAVTSAVTDVFPNLLRRFRETRPLVDLHVREIDTHHARDALLGREIDIAVIRQTATGKQLRSLPLRRDRFVIAIPPDHPTANSRGPVDLGNYRGDSWIWLPREISPGYHDELVTACRRAGFSPEPNHHANSIHSQLAMVEAGLGVTLAPESSVRRHARAIVWRELTDRTDMVELSIVIRNEAPEPLVDHFVSCAVPRV